MLRSAKILVVEDNFMTARHIAMIVKDFDGEVVGPAGSIAEALDLLTKGAQIDGAVLDVNLGDGAVTPVALSLIDHAIPVVIYSGANIPPDLAGLCSRLPVFSKPLEAVKAVSSLAQYVIGRNLVQNQPLEAENTGV